MRDFRTIVLLVGFTLLGSLALNLAAASLAGTTVIILRHAEKSDGSYDALLSPAGERRARFVADLLAESQVGALYATQFRRTQSTLQPLAERLGLEVQVVDADDPEVLVKRVREEHSGEIVVVASHSNRVPEIVEKLNAGKISPIDEDEYNRVFIVTLLNSTRATLLELTLSQSWLK